MKIKYSLFFILSIIFFLHACKKDNNVEECNTTVEIEVPDGNGNQDTVIVTDTNIVVNPNDTTDMDTVIVTDTTIIVEPDVIFTVNITDFENTNGDINLALYNSESSYDDEINPYIGQTLPVTGLSMQFEFANLPAGTYAIAIYHDENQNSELDTQFLTGAPTEGYGFSGNPGITFSKPSFNDVSFSIDGVNDAQQTIELVYIF